MKNFTSKPDRVKLTPEQLFNVYQECNTAGSPVKLILERNSLKPWDLSVIRKKIREAAIEALSGINKPGRKKRIVPLAEFLKVTKELEQTKDALASLGYEYSLLKKRMS